MNLKAFVKKTVLATAALLLLGTGSMTSVLAKDAPGEYEPESVNSTSESIPTYTSKTQYQRGLMALHANQAARIRVNHNFSSTTVYVVPEGGSFEIKSYVDQPVSKTSCDFSSQYAAENGCRWVESYHAQSDSQGFSQYDPAVMSIIGPTNLHTKMVITAIGSYVREGSADGEILATAKIGESYAVDEFAVFYAYGFSYSYVNFNGTWGYAQYDPAVMHPLDIPYN